jgi:hypothetical protein
MHMTAANAVGLLRKLITMMTDRWARRSQTLVGPARHVTRGPRPSSRLDTAAQALAVLASRRSVVGALLAAIPTPVAAGSRPLPDELKPNVAVVT